ncbi:hypothetical protein EW146_g7608 [Bondarzewia mesenterica]|uniref:Trafficking protein particle complex subunit 11 domain-containing protein n=1 Tax=Bondarzewia mesenterica TaxID=1095465 RepID=A0A4S4LKV2_9AGAM|nr:hypothetical protein EW146_g7608 [Bondarzewia mesenterica]
MNSYPPELLVQLAPVMFVAGLDVPTVSEQSASPSGSQSPTPSGRSQQDPFIVLTIRLRDALLAQRNVAIWQPEKSKTFQVILVDREVRFPPRKLSSPDDTHYTNAHSPLSPLTPSSPLHPDGLIAPIWVRKHTALVPSVFVLFTKLYETPHQPPKSPLDTQDPEYEREREQEERRRDAELSADIAQRKKSTTERGIKLTVVLMASRKMLDDPALDARLTYIRRQSGLDSRAALFVLSPVSPLELNDFVKSLQQALYEPAVEYYTSHSKRVRRKRNRHAQVTSSYVSPLSPAGSASIARPLRPEGWTVRYEYKMACFAEFRGEDEVALKHYQDSYSTLVNMFGSTAILPPRTKRWAEAKVLADCINIKICKLFLYNNEHALALSQNNIHMRKFGDFSRGWGIGEETFEYWSWIARQHRVFAELLEQGTRSTLTLPAHVPAPAPTAAALIASQTLQNSQRGIMEVDTMKVLGLNPSQALQHPGFYYYMSARATEKRRERFLTMLETATQQNINASPGFANERKVDHLTIILEGQGRLTLRIAYRIAQTYYESGKFDMAVRFFERIARTYRREKWGSMMRPLLTTWYRCAQRLGDVELSVKLLIEMLGHGTTFDTDEDGSIVEDLLAVLKSTVPSAPNTPLVVDLSESEPIFDSSVTFWKDEAMVDEPSAFQLSLKTPSNTSLSSLSFTSLAIYFSNCTHPFVIRHSAAASNAETTVVDLGDVPSDSATDALREVEANLQWGQGSTIVFRGTLASQVPTTLKVLKAVLTLNEGNWTVEIPSDPSSVREGSMQSPQWLVSVDPVHFVPVRRDNCSEVVVRHRPHLVQVSLSHHAPAYLDEEYPITIDITNLDNRAFHVVLDVLLQPTEIDEAGEFISSSASSGLIKGVDLGTVSPGVTVLKTLYLTNTGAGGDRVLDISIQSHHAPQGADASASPSSPSSPSMSLADTSETLQTLVIPTVAAIKMAYDVKYTRVGGSTAGLLDLRTFDDEYWDNGDGGRATVEARLECVGPWSLSVEKVRLIRKNGPHAKIVDCSLDEDEDNIASEWLPGDEFGAICRIDLSPEDEPVEGDAITGPGEYEFTWRRILPNGDHGPLCATLFPLPLLRPPRDGLIALLDLPSTAKLHVPFHAYLTIRNRHPSLTATVSVQLETETSDAFLVAGLRSGRVPILLPGAEERLAWTLVPVECGFVHVPKIVVVDKRKAAAAAVEGDIAPAMPESEGDIVKIVDVRREARGEDGTTRDAGKKTFSPAYAEGLQPSLGVTKQDDIGSILVLPREFAYS